MLSFGEERLQNFEQFLAFIGIAFPVTFFFFNWLPLFRYFRFKLNSTFERWVSAELIYGDLRGLFA